MMNNKIESLLEMVEEIKDSGICIIVEGKKDKIALEKIGLSNIVLLRGSIFSLCEEISRHYKEVMILTDLDKEGKKIYSKLKACLEKDGVKINDSFRNFLFKETELRQIEGINTYISRFQLFK